jgi:hypothetical protein
VSSGLLRFLLAYDHLGRPRGDGEIITRRCQPSLGPRPLTRFHQGNRLVDIAIHATLDGWGSLRPVAPFAISLYRYQLRPRPFVHPSESAFAEAASDRRQDYARRKE